MQGSKPNHLTVSTGKVKKVEVLKQSWSHLVNINYSLNGEPKITSVRIADIDILLYVIIMINLHENMSNCLQINISNIAKLNLS